MKEVVVKDKKTAHTGGKIEQAVELVVQIGREQNLVAALWVGVGLT